MPSPIVKRRIGIRFTWMFSVLLILASPLALAQYPRSHVGAGFNGGRAGSGAHQNYGRAPVTVAPSFSPRPGRSLYRGGSRYYYGARSWSRSSIGYAWSGYPHYWNGGYWRGAYWPRVYYRVGFPLFLYTLPAFYATYWYDGIPYYYADDAYYVWNREDGRYVATDPPPVADSAGDTSSSSNELFIYPRNGQSTEQQALDKRECRQWADEQTDSDSASDHQRAMIACLDGRGYTAK